MSLETPGWNSGRSERNASMTHLLRSFFMAGLFVTIFAANPASAADAQGKAKTIVLLVGVGGFTDPAIQALPTAENDAKAPYDLFVSQKYLTADKAPVRLVF